MEKEEFLTQLKKVLPSFNFNEEINMGKCIHGGKKVPQIEYRDETKATIRIEGVRSIFVSSKMGTEHVFFYYATVKTMGQKRVYRHKKFYDVEIDKVFVSGATYEILLEQFENQRVLVNG